MEQGLMQSQNGMTTKPEQQRMGFPRARFFPIHYKLAVGAARSGFLSLRSANP